MSGRAAAIARQPGAPCLMTSLYRCCTSCGRIYSLESFLSAVRRLRMLRHAHARSAGVGRAAPHLLPRDAPNERLEDRQLLGRDGGHVARAAGHGGPSVYRRRERGSEKEGSAEERSAGRAGTAGAGVEAEMRAWEQGCAGELALSRSDGRCHAAAWGCDAGEGRAARGMRGAARAWLIAAMVEQRQHAALPCAADSRRARRRCAAAGGARPVPAPLLPRRPAGSGRT